MTRAGRGDEPPVALAVAGTDSGGAAGLAADLATLGHLGVHGACVVTAVTAQDTTGVHAVHRVPVPMVEAQLAAVLDDLPVAGVKTGMLGSPAVVDLVAHLFSGHAGAPGPSVLVVDPVLVATSGAVLGDEEVVRAYRRVLLPVASVITPNLDEARRLLADDTVSAPVAAQRLAEWGCAVVLTGGDEGGDDWLVEPGQGPVLLSHRQVATRNDHGTGCTHASALTALLSHGVPLTEAARGAAAYVGAQLRVGAEWRLGRGRGPVPHVVLPSTHGAVRTRTAG